MWRDEGGKLLPLVIVRVPGNTHTLEEDPDPRAVTLDGGGGGMRVPRSEALRGNKGVAAIVCS